MPTTKISELNSPTKASRSASGTPISRRYDGTRAKIWLTPAPSTIEVIQKTATRTRQSCFGRGRAGRGPGSGVTTRAYRDRGVACCSVTERGRCPEHTKMPEGTGRKPANRPPFGSEQVRSLRVPPVNLARWPCDQRTWLPIPLRGSLPGRFWRFAPAPSGKTKCRWDGLGPQRPYPRKHGNVPRAYPRVSHHCGRFVEKRPSGHPHPSSTAYSPIGRCERGSIAGTSRGDERRLGAAPR